MDFLYSLFSGIAGMFKKQETTIAADLQHHSWNSMRTIVILAFVGYLLYISHLILTPENLKLTAFLVSLLVVCNTISKCVTNWANVRIREAANDVTARVSEPRVTQPAK